MGKVGYILPEDKKKEAIANGLALQTVYSRLKRGWEVDRAVSEKPRDTIAHHLERSPTGELLPQDKKGKQRAFRLPSLMDGEVDQAIASSGLSPTKWYTLAIKEYLVKSSRDRRKKKTK